MAGESYDVIVIGAGFGGSACAGLLAKEGLRVLLVEKNKQAGGKAMSLSKNGHTYTAWVVIGAPVEGNLYQKLLDELEVTDLASLVVPGTMPEGDVEVGYFLKRSAWGNGYATEACRRIVRFAFEDSPLDEVVATFDPGNTASQRVLEKSGFVHHGTRRCYGDDGVDYRISRADWLRSRSGG